VSEQRLVVAALFVVGLLIGSAALLVPGGSAAQSAFPGGPYFIVPCGFSHHSNDDPIVFPQQPGRSHSHTFIGNRSTDAASTHASLQASPTTCEPADDASAYWFPTLFEGGVAVRPLTALVYYVRRTSAPVRAMPARLRMIAGNSEARRPQGLHVASWGCGAVDGGRRFRTIPRCSKDNFLNLRVEFPSCWDGRGLDSPDHKRHMAYASSGRCPRTHPVAFPAISLVVLYPATRPDALLSSGPFSVHADFVNAWNQDVLERITQQLN
jgi:Domain of unknown function (DUF1996)